MLRKYNLTKHNADNSRHCFQAIKIACLYVYLIGLFVFVQMHNLPSPFKTACEDKHLAGFKKYTKSACLLKCRADYVISMCKCRSYDLEGESLWTIQILKMSLDSYFSKKTFISKAV